MYLSHKTNDNISVQGSLMCLIDHNEVVLIQQRVLHDFANQ